MVEKEIFASIRNLNANKDSTIWDARTCQLAPHKPLLLLSIMDGIEIGWITEPKIVLGQDLIETFFRYWKNIMGDRNTTIALPFFHMKSEPFWTLDYNEGMKPYQNSPSLGGLMKRVSHAELDDGLFRMCNDNQVKQVIRRAILETYFSDELQSQILDIRQVNIGAYDYAKQLELLAAEPFTKYHADNNSSESYSWQKTQQRQHGFRLKVRGSYNHQCAVCRARVRTPHGKSLVEGAHIIPWSESKNDDPRNGLALCKTHHWMFDTHLLTVQPDYQITLSAWLKKEGEQIESTLAWDRKQILLPEERFMPSEAALEERYQLFESAR